MNLSVLYKAQLDITWFDKLNKEDVIWIDMSGKDFENLSEAYIIDYTLKNH